MNIGNNYNSVYGDTYASQKNVTTKKAETKDTVSSQSGTDSAEQNLCKKDTFVKYEFNTTDEYGNKVMDKMSKEETIKALNSISSQYGENVIVQFSGDALAALVEDGKFMSNKTMTAEETAAKAARDAAFQAESVIQLENTHRIIIPNFETNEQLYDSLSGADDSVISSTMGIISNYLMPSNATGMSEQERQDMTAFGLETAKYLAENYLDEVHASNYISAMETIAKYGLNGSVSESGKVTYDIQQGRVTMSNAPDSYVDMESWLKVNDTELYNQIYELNQSIINHKDGESHAAKFIELYTKATKEILSASEDTKNGNEYREWKKVVEKTELPNTFKNVKYNDFTSFSVSLQNQSCLSDSWINENVSRFMKWLTA